MLHVPFYGPVSNEDVEFIEKLVIDTVRVARAWNKAKHSQEEL